MAAFVRPSSHALRCLRVTRYTGALTSGLRGNNERERVLILRRSCNVVRMTCTGVADVEHVSPGRPRRYGESWQWVWLVRNAPRTWPRG